MTNISRLNSYESTGEQVLRVSRAALRLTLMATANLKTRPDRMLTIGLHAVVIIKWVRAGVDTKPANHKRPCPNYLHWPGMSVKGKEFGLLQRCREKIGETKILCSVTLAPIFLLVEALLLFAPI